MSSVVEQNWTKIETSSVLFNKVAVTSFNIGVIVEPSSCTYNAYFQVIYELTFA